MTKVNEPSVAAGKDWQRATPGLAAASLSFQQNLTRFTRSPVFPLATSTLVLIGLFIVGDLTLAGFFSIASIDSVLVLGSFLGIAAVGQTLAVLLGGIDLAVPFIMDMSNVTAAQLAQEGVPFVAAAIVALVAGAGVGCLDGYIARKLRVHPLIITLGMGYAVQAAVEIWTNGAPSGIAPGWLSRLVAIGARIGGVQVAPVVIIWAVIALVVVFGLRRTSLGRRIYAVGTNPVAAQLALVNPTTIWTISFGISGFFAALAGVLLLGFTSGTLATVGDPYLFLSVGAVVVGGTSLVGGRGGYGGTLIGALLITVLDTILVGLGYSDAGRQLLIGVVIILAVSLFGRETHVRDRV
jgi:ribose transport system permease protein